MSFLTAGGVGHPTEDLVLKTGENSSYCFFTLAVNKGYGDKQTTEYVECRSYRDVAERLVKAKVGKSSLIHVEGDAEARGFLRRNGDPGASIRIYVTNWHFLPLSSKKNTGDGKQPTDQESAQSAAVAATISDAPESGTVDGDGDLPW